MCYQTDLANVQPKIKAYVRSRIFNDSDANDLVQEVNQILIKKESEFKESGNFSAWAMAITRYQIMGYLKALKRKKGHVSFDENPAYEKASLGKEEEQDLWLSDIPLIDMVQDEVASLKQQLLSIFTPLQKDVFKLLCQGYSIAEVGEKLGKSYRSVSIARHRLVKQAKAHLKSLNRKNRYDYRSKG